MFEDTHTHTFNGPLSRNTRVGRYQKDKTNLDFIEVRDSEWQWHQLGRMQVCTSLQADNHASTPPLSFFTGRMLFLPPNQQCQRYLNSKIKTSLDLNEAREDGVFGMQWHQLDHMQTVCTLLQTDNHSNTSSLSKVNHSLSLLQ